MRRNGVVASLGVAQTLAWASSYYLPAVLAQPIARDLDVGPSVVYGAFSVAMAVAGLVGPASGRAIDRWGGRPVLVATNAAFALGLAALASARDGPGLFAAWALIGLAMGSGLYEAAFAAAVRLWGTGSRGAITGITLFAGFASTVGWPLSAWMEARWGWRGACLGWAALHLVVALPLNASLPRPSARGRAEDDASGVDAASAASPPEPAPMPRASERLAMGLLGFVFAVTWFTSTAMATHLPALLQSAGVGLATAVAIGALIGPAQVAARLLEAGVLRRLHPLLSARLAALGHPAGAVLLLAAGPAWAPAFALLHGGGNGIMTIAKGTLPLALFGSRDYGARQGWLMLPARIAQALAPLAFGLALERWGAAALWGTGLLGVSALAALAVLRAPLSRGAA
ncbi:MAG TPA: MFS transporter [Burkholderiaceae bacterium]|nr:MFS transporter [Burkholderiaceae bacterium]